MTVRSVVLDVDGTLVWGDEPIPGAVETVDRLRECGLDVLLLSNNPTRTPAAYADRLAGLGFAVGPDEVVTSGALTADYLAAGALCVGMGGNLLPAAALEAGDEATARDLIRAALHGAG